EQRRPAIAGDGAGGAFVAWEDRRSTLYAAYVQHIIAAGAVAPGWPVGGLMVCPIASFQRTPAIAPDGAGGVFVAWQDSRAGYDIYLQRFTGDGAIAPGWSPTGNVVCAAPGDQRAPAIVSDGSGGVYLAWTDRRNGSDDDIYAHRFSGAGA